MNQSERNKVLNTMLQIGKQVDSHLDIESQERGNITYYSDFKFSNSGLGAKNVYIVETPIKKVEKTGDKNEIRTIYELYDKDCNLIATVTEDGKLHFMPEYLEELRKIDAQYFEELNLENLKFELPKELEQNDIVMTKGELKEHEEKSLDSDKKEKSEKSHEREKEEKQEKDLIEEKKQQTAKALGIDISEIKSMCTINPKEKITDKYNLIDIMPEAGKYDEVSIVYSAPNDKSQGKFTILGASKDGKTKRTMMTPLTSIESVEGTSTNKNVISINEDGTKVTEKQVKGLFRINSRGRNDGISISIGNYGMMDVDYVSNVMDKEHRRATPIRTKGPENVRISSSEVRENAGDSIEEVEREGRIFRAREERGVNPQSLDGIDTDQADGGKITLEELKEHIKEETLKQGEMSKSDTREFIKSEISKSGLELSKGEIEHTTDEIEEKVLDESRFPTREPKSF